MSDPRLKTYEYKIKALYMRLFGVLFRKGNNRRIPLDPAKIKKVLFIRPDRLGDTICSLPLIDAVRKNIPGVEVGIIGSEKNRVLLEQDPRFNRVFVYRRHILKDILMAFRVRRYKYDCLIDLMADDSATALSLVQVCSKGRPRVGVGKRKHAEYYDCNVDYSKGDPEHIIDIYLKVLKAFGIDPSGCSGYAPPFIPPAAIDTADRFLSGLPRNGRITIGFNLSVRLSNRIWGHEKSCRLIKMILQDYPDVRFVLVTAPSDRARGVALQSRIRERVHLVPDRMSFLEACAVISRLDMLITADTSVVHVARSFKVPVLGMYPEFGRIYRQWRPYGQIGGLVLSRGGDDIYDITPEQVYDAFAALATTIEVKT